MKIPLSLRLLTCCSFVAPGDRVADIGCDHGYLGIYLLTKGIASSVIAADINQGPLDSARRNAAKFGTAGKMTFHLSNGVQSIPRDFDSMVCAGMGADVMISILEAAPWLQDSKYRLILQCQSRTPQLRKYLSQTGWQITEETVLRDGRFLYTVLVAQWNPGTQLTPGQCYISPALLESGAAELDNYRKWVIDHLRLHVNGQSEHAEPDEIAALQELESLTPPASTTQEELL